MRAALAYAERLLRADPLREETCRLLMRLHDARGDAARALRVYHACAAALERELGVEPSPATRAAYEALLPGAHRTTDESGQALLIGRAEERARLTRLWRAAEDGHARLVLVTGEPGIGKSRLVEELRSWCAHRGAATAEARSYEAEGALAYGPVVAWLRSEALAPRRVRLDPGRLRELSRVLPEVPGTPQPLPADEQRQRLFDAIVRAILCAAAPVLLVADDLQWADEQTLQFLHYLLRSEPRARLLVAATARSEDADQLTQLVAGLRALDRIEEIELERLSRGETGVLAERFTGRALPEDEVERLFAETEGNPLFVIETLRAGALSPRVQAVIESRMARLSSAARDVASLAASVGREFTADVLARASDLGDDALVGALDELWRRRIVRVRAPDGYDFTHDRIRDVTYRSLAPAQRRRAHVRIARALAAGSADAALVAAQLDRGGAADEAVTWYERAAEDALRMHADAEAVRALRRALELVRDPGRELALTTALIAPLAMLEGFASEGLGRAQRRALELASEPGLAAVAFAGDHAPRDRRLRRRAAVWRTASRRGLNETATMYCAWRATMSSAWPRSGTVISMSRGAISRLRLRGSGPSTASRTSPATGWTRRPYASAGSGTRCCSSAIRTKRAAPAIVRLRSPRRSGIRRPVARCSCSRPWWRWISMTRMTSGATPVLLPSGAKSIESPAVAFMAEACGGYVDILDGDRGGLQRVKRAEEMSRTAPAPGSHAVAVHVLRAACQAAGDVEAARAAAQIPLDIQLWDRERSWNAGGVEHCRS